MRRLGSRHRAVSILNFSTDGWDLPLHLRKDPAVDPFVIPSSYQTVVNPPQDGVSVWLSLDGKLQHVIDLPNSRKNLVVPSEVPQLPPHLTNARISHIVFPDGHHLVIQDTWNTLKSNRALDQSWTGAVIFTACSGADNNLGRREYQMLRFADSSSSFSSPPSEGGPSQSSSSSVLKNANSTTKQNNHSSTKSPQSQTCQDQTPPSLSQQSSISVSMEAMPMTASAMPTQEPPIHPRVEVFDMSSWDGVMKVDVPPDDKSIKGFHDRLKAFLETSSDSMNRFVAHAMMNIQSPTRALSKVKQLCGNRRPHQHGQLETASNEIDRGQLVQARQGQLRRHQSH